MKLFSGFNIVYIFNQEETSFNLVLISNNNHKQTGSLFDEQLAWSKIH
jgi:hypothetical protein